MIQGRLSKHSNAQSQSHRQCDAKTVRIRVDNWIGGLEGGGGSLRVEQHLEPLAEAVMRSFLCRHMAILHLGLVSKGNDLKQGWVGYGVREDRGSFGLESHKKRRLGLVLPIRQCATSLWQYELYE